VKKLLKNPWIIFFLISILVFCVFLFIPLALFDGEIIFENKVNEWKVNTKLTLAQVVGFGIREEDLIDVKDFYLVFQGYVLLALMQIAFPALIAYRFHILFKSRKK
jgi:hypothetical protein